MKPNLAYLKGKKIVFFLGNLQMGGAERQALILATYFKNTIGAEVEFWGIDASAEYYTNKLKDLDIPWLLLPWIRRGKSGMHIGYFLNYLSMVRKKRPLAIISYIYDCHLFGSLAFKLTGLGLHIWNQRDMGLAHQETPLEKAAFRFCKTYVTNSLGGKQYLMEKGKVDEKLISLIYNSIDIPEHVTDKLEERKKWSLAPDQFAVCMVANLHENKDHKTLLKAWKEVLQSLQPGEKKPILLLAGLFGATHHELKSQCFDDGLDTSEVRFLGQVKETNSLLSAIDLGVLSSRSEGTPNGLLECMALSKPVAGTDIIGIRGAVGEENYAFLAPPNDSNVLAEIILHFYRNPDLCKETGSKNLKRIKTHFSKEKIFSQYTDLILNRLAK